MNEDTIRAARLEKPARKLYQEVAACQYQLVFATPEQEESEPFKKMIDSDMFKKNLRRHFVDEFHVIDDWGNDFREAYLRIGVTRHLLGPRVSQIAMSATVCPGAQQKRLLENLGFSVTASGDVVEGTVAFLRLPLDRPTVKYTSYFLTHRLNATCYPDIAFAIPLAASIPSDIPLRIIACGSIATVHDVVSYMRNLLRADFPHRDTIVMPWHSLMSANYMAWCLSEFGKEDGCVRIIAATDGLCVGVNTPTKDLIVLHQPDSFAGLVQWMGRVREGGEVVVFAQPWMRVPGGALTTAEPIKTSAIAGSYDDDLNIPGASNGSPPISSSALSLNAPDTATRADATPDVTELEQLVVDGGKGKSKAAGKKRAAKEHASASTSKPPTKTDLTDAERRGKLEPAFLAFHNPHYPDPANLSCPREATSGGFGEPFVRPSDGLACCSFDNPDSSHSDENARRAADVAAMDTSVDSKAVGLRTTGEFAAINRNPARRSRVVEEIVNWRRTEWRKQHNVGGVWGVFGPEVLLPQPALERLAGRLHICTSRERFDQLMGEQSGKVASWRYCDTMGASLYDCVVTLLSTFSSEDQASAQRPITTNRRNVPAQPSKLQPPASLQSVTLPHPRQSTSTAESSAVRSPLRDRGTKRAVTATEPKTPRSAKRMRTEKEQWAPPLAAPQFLSPGSIPKGA